MKAIPTVQKYMTTLPHTIGADQTLEKAEGMMREFRVKHLPVLKAGELVGILTERDIRLVESFKDIDLKSMTVDEAYSPDPYMTSPDGALDEVCATMVSKHYSCVLVTDAGKLVGVFTWIDALQAFSELLGTRLKH